MQKNLGVPVEHFAQAVIDSYKQGFADAMECLKRAETTIDTEKMKKSIIEKIEEQAKIKAEW